MSPEERELLERGLSLSEDNNKILHYIRRSMRIANIIRFIYWALIIGSAIGAYYFIQPYVDQLIGIYGGAKSNLDSVGSMFKDLKK